MNQDGGDKTEKATPKKRRDARERGQVLKSTEANTAFCSVVMFGFLLLYWPTFTQQMTLLYTDYLNNAFVTVQSRDIDVAVVEVAYTQTLISMGMVLLPILLCALLSGLIANVLQVGFLFTTKTLQPKLERINPLQGFKRIFSTRTLTELVKSLLKVICLGYILYGEYEVLLTKFPGFMRLDVYTAFLEIMNMAFLISLKMCLALIVIAAFDFFYQWWRYEKDLRMSKQEIKDEYKLTEGDPQIKGKIRQKQRQMSAMRMMDRVPSADVVVTNPTHYAIALKYAEGQSAAPVVLAKGKDFMARKIKEIAKENNIEMVENRPLAQALFQHCEIDDEIPPEFYQAVADILVYVYKLKQRMRGGDR